VVTMGKHRDRLETVAAVLTASGMGTRKTRIMEEANLSFPLLERYLKAVLALGFVQVDGRNYILTDKGRNFLSRYNHYQERYIGTRQSLEFLSTEYNELLRLCKSQCFTGSL
jgi:predicted transcriptional regulator